MSDHFNYLSMWIWSPEIISIISLPLTPSPALMWDKSIIFYLGDHFCKVKIVSSFKYLPPWWWSFLTSLFSSFFFLGSTICNGALFFGKFVVMKTSWTSLNHEWLFYACPLKEYVCGLTRLCVLGLKSSYLDC